MPRTVVAETDIQPLVTTQLQMSVPVRNLRGMSKNRRPRTVRKVRHGARQPIAPHGQGPVDTTFRDAIRSALARHPIGLLSVASLVINGAKPDSIARLKSGRPDENYLDNVLGSLIGMQSRETAVLLALVAELLVDDPEPQRRCREELARRGEHPPRWIAALPQAQAYRSVRRTHSLGDIEEFVVGVRLHGGRELTAAVQTDHNLLSGIVDAAVLPDPIDRALVQLADANPDAEVKEMSLADTRVYIEHALAMPRFAPVTETWPLYRGLVRWLAGRLPEGGVRRPPGWEYEAAEDVCDKFFASGSAAPFTASSHAELLIELCDTGSGDPLRWSAARVEGAIGRPVFSSDWIPLEVVLDAPDLLRAFIPFAHAQSGIRDELTSRAIAVIDETRLRYRREALREAAREFDEAV